MVQDDFNKLLQYSQIAEDRVPIEEYTDTVVGFFEHIENQLKELSEGERNSFYMMLNELSDSTKQKKMQQFLWTVLLDRTKDEKYSRKLCESLGGENFNPDASLFLVEQLISFEFLNPGTIDGDSLEILYEQVVDYWKEYVVGISDFSKRTENRLLIISTQVISDRHAPTKTLFERVEILGKELGKDLLVIHARETMTQKELFPCYGCKQGNVDNGYNGTNSIKLPSGYSFQMYQPSNSMPNEKEILHVIEMVNDFAPSEIIVMGDHCVLGDVLADYYPTISMAFGFSILQKATNHYSVVFREMTQKDYEKIDAWKVDRENYFSGVFTFKFIPQSSTLTRKELNLPEDAFVISIIGNRIGSDITDDFISMLERLDNQNWHIMLAGAPAGFDYENACIQYPVLKEHSTYLGYVNDILAVLECCDLYVNPPRLGGGFSVAEAFSKGVPGVSLDYGDVAAAAGSQFCVHNLDEMKDIIDRYMSDKEFYEGMSKKAIERAKILQDGKTALENILREFRNRYQREQ